MSKILLSTTPGDGPCSGSAPGLVLLVTGLVMPRRTQSICTSGVHFNEVQLQIYVRLTYAAQ